MNRKPILIVLAILGLAGCTTLAPDYTRPPAPVPAAWPSGPAYKETASQPTGVAAADLAWRDFFVAEGLRKVIELALANNRDLRLAALTMEKTRALYQIQRAELFPPVTGLLWPHPQPERSSLGAVPGQRTGPPQCADHAGKRSF
jgi:multidrug efflux system outer membrane protein